MAVDLTSSPTAVGAVITELRVLHEEAMADRLPCGWDRRQQSGQKHDGDGCRRRRPLVKP